MQESQFWKLYKEDQPRCSIVMKTSVGLVQILACLLEPFMPSFSLEVIILAADFHAACDTFLSSTYIICYNMQHVLRFFLFWWHLRYSSSLIWNLNNFHLLMKKEILIGQEGLGTFYLLVTKLGNQSHCLKNWYFENLFVTPSTVKYVKINSNLVNLIDY